MIDCEKLLKKGLSDLHIDVSALQLQQLLAYIALLDKWNKHFNLTAVRSVEEMIGRHLLDSFSILPHLQGEKIVDVGTGAGLPGIPLSIYCQDKTFFLLDSNQKKQIFVTQAVKTLDLINVQCVHSLVERYQPSQKFSTILTRAFAPLPRMIALTAHLLADNGRFLAMMGKVCSDQLKIPSGYQLEQVISLNVPGEKGQRHLAIIVKD